MLSERRYASHPYAEVEKLLVGLAAWPMNSNL